MAIKIVRSRKITRCMDCGHAKTALDCFYCGDARRRSLKVKVNKMRKILKKKAHSKHFKEPTKVRGYHLAPMCDIIYNPLIHS